MSASGASGDSATGDGLDGDEEQVILTVIHPVTDYDTWIDYIRGTLPSLAKRGVVGMRVLRAVDDPNEVLVALNMRTREHAERIMVQDEGLQQGMDVAGISMYPAVFIGRVAERFDVAETLLAD